MVASYLHGFIFKLEIFIRVVAAVVCTFMLDRHRVGTSVKRPGKVYDYYEPGKSQ